ncbi:hypothetical protein DFJ43DRAFT_1038927 [Lentinula guzmanii]|uniref:DUF6532 domain-containing protein n=1 Tax=Lentinula guzmanii TaxID=2804957 RepID=A0AA38JTS5_9AGAR|nr:hypothetical protein DFJ43DRAFT_1038927 [Lentinula guzmanii]
MDVELEEVSGEFDGDIGAEILEAERDAKSSGAEKGKSISKAIIDVKLEPADVNIVEAEERATGKIAQPRARHQTGKADLPLVLQTDYNIWSNSLIPDLVEWCGTQPDQLGVNGNIEFRPKLRELWMEHLGKLPHISEFVKHNGHTIARENHPAIYTYAQSQIRTYRSKLGQNALKFVGDEVKTFESIIERKKHVERLLHNDAFSYESPGMTRATSSGLFRGHLVIKTFAFHLTWALSSKLDSGHPIGALALSAAAVERALTIWKTGEERKRKSSRNNEDSFSEEWAPTVARFARALTDMKEEKWEMIYNISEAQLLAVPKGGAGPELKKLLKEALKTRQVSTPGTAMDLDDDPLVVSD